MFSEGQKLKADCVAFSRKLETRPLFENWVSQTLAKKWSVAGNVFSVTKSRKGIIFEDFYMLQSNGSMAT